MALFTPLIDPDAVQIFRLEASEVLGCAAPRPFSLDGYDWPTAEHYYQAMKYPERPRFHDILKAPTVELARKHGRGWLKRKRADWSKVRTVVMTRALYTQCHAYPEFAAALLATSDKPIVEIAQYDYFWGVGRDQRGENQYGKILVKLREKLRNELCEEL
jgi:hypothetical protein